MQAAVSFREAFFKERESLVKQIRDEQAERLAELPEEALIWQALVPSWTRALAEASEFPTSSGTPVEETLRRIEAFASSYSGTTPPVVDNVGEDTSSRSERRIEASADSPAVDDPDADLLSGRDLNSFWMPNSLRADILQRIIHDVSRGLPYLQQTITLIGEKLRQAESSGVTVPDTAQRWAQLASMAQKPRELARWLDQKTDELLSKDESGELLRWIEVARPLEELLGNELTNSLRRAARLLELHHRLEDDKRRLTKFLARHEQIKAFEDLVNDPAGGWALHYLGSGGMGKTMLIRYLTAKLAQELKASTARIDFDYLNPDYPAHAPGLLLAQLAEELRVHDHSGAASSSFASFIEKVFNLHERLSTTAPSAQFSLETVMAPIYAELPLLVEGLNQLPKPIIIILDTCEELAKIRVDGTTPLSVQATFEILERLYQLQPDLRVVFGGRRPLASSGTGWTSPGSDLLPRRYLRAHEIRGFTLAEATTYLTEIEKVPAETVKLIIDNSLIKKSAPGRLNWSGVGAETDQSDRYHPFDLSLYAAWVTDDPDLPLSALENAADRYIDMRIVARLRHPGLLNLMPAVALLGRFDFNTVCAVSRMDETSFSNLFIELSNQEWINRQSSNFLEVDQGLQPRLLDYYQRTKPREMEKVRRAIVTHLEKVTIEEDRSDLDVSHFRSAFRLLKPEPERASKWWERVETRFAEEEAYNWLRNICEVILGDEEDSGSDGSKDRQGAEGADLRAAVRASYAAALTHIGPFDKLETTWGEVLRYADKHPLKNGAVRLIRRARAGQLAAAARYEPRGPDEQQIQWLWETLNQINNEDLSAQVASSLIAALEAVIEFFERRGRKPFPHPGPLVHFSSLLNEPTYDQELAWFASALTGRLLALSENWTEAEEWFRRSISAPGKTIARRRRRSKAGSQPATEAAAETLSPEVTPQIWLDWRAPDQLRSRVRLEFIRNMYPTYNPPEVLALVGDNISEPTTIDTDRLGAAILKLRAASGPLASKESEDLAWKSRHSIQHESLCNAHRSFPPLFAIVAEAAAAEGKVDEAIGRLISQSLASETVEQLATVMEADRACLRIARRTRLLDEDVAASTSVHSSVELDDLALLWAIEGLSNPRKDAPLGIESLLERAQDPQHRLALLHARFRATYTLRPEMANALVHWATRFMKSAERLTPEATFAEVSCFLDCLEINQISRWQKLDQPFPKLRISQIKGTKIWRDKQVRPLERLTLLLRHAALDASPSTIVRLDTKLAEGIGYRRAAKVALDEGELLALRFPSRAARLLNKAHRWHVRAKDFIGAFVAKTCMALALIQSGQNAGFARALKRVERDYSYVQTRALTSLPKWETLTAIAENPQVKSLDGLAPIGWRPWLVRLIACLVWQKDGYRSRDRSQLLARWVAANYGTTSETETSLPAELDGWLTAETRTSPATRTRTYLSILQAKRSAVWQSLERETEVFLALQGEDKQVKEKVTVMGLASYRAAAHNLLGQLYVVDSQVQPEVLASLASQDVIVIKVDYPSSWLCWEGIMGYALQEAGRLDPDKLRFQRTVRDSRTRRTVQWNKVSEVLTWTNDLHAAEIARAGWSPMLDIGSLEIVDSESISFHNYNPQAQVLHIIGAPVETSAGVRLDLSSSRLWRQESKGAGGGSAGGGLDPYSNPPGAGGGLSVRGFSSKGDLVKADNLYSLFPNMAVCILQANPRTSGGPGKRTQSDREQAAYLRLMGAELFRLGVPVVITLPALVSEIAPAVLQQIAQGFLYFHGKSPTDPFLLKTWSSKSPTIKRWSTKLAVPAFLSAIREIHALVKQSAATDDDDRAEMFLDVCLYAADVKA